MFQKHLCVDLLAMTQDWMQIGQKPTKFLREKYAILPKIQHNLTKRMF
jgi:hypothetical protein